MATALDVTESFEKCKIKEEAVDEHATTQDTTKSKEKKPEQIAIACWNIMGDANVNLRKEVVSDIFKKKAELRDADIICLQEVTVTCEGDMFKEYIPCDSSYLYEQSVEPTGNRHNVILFKKDKFSKLENGTEWKMLEDAFQMMDNK